MGLKPTHRKPIRAILVLVCLSLFSWSGHSASPLSLVDGNTMFALDLYGQLRTNEGNLFFSPYSISTCLAMAYAGARGNTEKQMARTLHFGSDRETLHGSIGELQRELGRASQGQGVELNIANALWAQKDHPFLPEFLEIAQAQYQANVKQADFKAHAEAERSEINGWVAEKTKNKIEEILPPGSLNSGTRLVLANAIYFKALWASPYDKAETTTQPFHLSKVRQVDVPLMHHFEDGVKYVENNDFQAVELRYQSNAFSMVILLPRQVDGCAGLESRLTTALLAQTLNQMKAQRIEIFLPRFKLESAINLNGMLAGLGIKDAFEPKADFSGIDGARDLFISGVFHKAWGEVNEEGTEAAAATAATITLSAIQKPVAAPPIFRADHPFVFFIRHTRSGSLLFLGRFSNPAS